MTSKLAPSEWLAIGALALIHVAVLAVLALVAWQLRWRQPAISRWHREPSVSVPGAADHA